MQILCVHSNQPLIILLCENILSRVEAHRRVAGGKMFPNR